jgi:hypothetical protein
LHSSARTASLSVLAVGDGRQNSTPLINRHGFHDALMRGKFAVPLIFYFFYGSGNCYDRQVHYTPISVPETPLTICAAAIWCLSTRRPALE